MTEVMFSYRILTLQPMNGIALNIDLPNFFPGLSGKVTPQTWGLSEKTSGGERCLTEVAEPKQTNGGALPWGPTHPAEPSRARRFFRAFRRFPGHPDCSVTSLLVVFVSKATHVDQVLPH